jgi:hypothetical protein
MIDHGRGIPARRVLKLTQDAAKARWLATALLGRRPVKLRKVSFVLHTPELLYRFGTWTHGAGLTSLRMVRSWRCRRE